MADMKDAGRAHCEVAGEHSSYSALSDIADTLMVLLRALPE